ncbi:hypothetical protein ACFFIY_11980 [Bhargavaea ullalensis]|uniref:Thiopeptide-type bacteriocin biosynthesis domain-containing protein n=1 Tax=Bhargavaea ullalensis TaxID=1265685 RepID=A0ABV2G7G3_9BACL
MKDVKIFNFNRAADTAFVRTLITRAREIGVPYYISRSWESGPHLTVTFDGDAEKTDLERFAGLMNVEADKIPAGAGELARIRAQYEKSAGRIALLEGKAVPAEMAGHGTVRIVDNRFDYHNPGLTRIIHDMRFELQQALEETYFRIHGDGEPATVLMPLLFHHVAETYRESGRNKGYFSFISHVQGFFELAEKQGLPYSEPDFEKQFRIHAHDISMLDAKGDPHIKHWKEVWGKISESYKSEILRHIDESYQETIRQSVGELESGFNNDFHRQFAAFFHRTGFLSNMEAINYRFMVNVLYLSLPFLKVSALKKQQFIYMAYRYNETLTSRTWREEIGI